MAKAAEGEDSKVLKINATTCRDIGSPSHAKTAHSPSGSAQRLRLQAYFIGFLAIMHLFLICCLLNGSMHPATQTAVHLRISYSREAVREAVAVQGDAQVIEVVRDEDDVMASVAQSTSLEEATALSMHPDRQLREEGALRAAAALNSGSRHADSHSGVVCRSMAAKQLVEQTDHFHHDERPLLVEPLEHAPFSGVILATYFGSRVSPNRCWRYQDGALPKDSFAELRPLSDAVERLGLAAVLFHDDALSDDFVAHATSEITFQRVELQRQGWSLADERWAVYKEWLESPVSAGVEWVVAIDLWDVTLARNPIKVMAAHEFDVEGSEEESDDEESEGNEMDLSLWTDALPASQRAAARFERCYGSRTLAPGDKTFNKNVVGGGKAAFLRLTHLLVSELESLGGSDTMDAWDCEGPALHHVLRRQEEQGLLAGDSPGWVGAVEDCTERGLCNYAIYRS